MVTRLFCHERKLTDWELLYRFQKLLDESINMHEIQPIMILVFCYRSLQNSICREDLKSIKNAKLQVGLTTLHCLYFSRDGYDDIFSD